VKKIITILFAKVNIAFTLLLRYRRGILLFFAALFIFLSFFLQPRGHFFERDVEKLEHRIQVRQKILEDYAQQALNYPVDEWLKLVGFPGDMVIYKYNADTIQSWLNEFPIGNDEVDILPLWYKMHYLSTNSLYNNPLAYVSEKEQYVNLGSAWYVVKAYTKEREKVIAGLLIQTDYPSNNTVLPNKINPKFNIKQPLTLTPNFFDDGYIVHGKEGEPLFSVIKELNSDREYGVIVLRWMAVLFALIALFSFYYRERTFKVFCIYVCLLTLIRLYCYKLGELASFNSKYFSPNLYADTGLFSSFGNFLLNNLYVFFVLLALYMLRKNFILYYKKRSRRSKRVIITMLSLFILMIVAYISYTLRSIITNSSITLELYKLEELSTYSILTYVSYALLFIGLLLMLQFTLPVVTRVKSNVLLSIKATVIYIFIIALFSQSVVSYLSFQKEQDKCRVWSNKLSVERDLDIEIKLLSIEHKLANDPVMKVILEMPERITNLLQSRLDELYFQRVGQRYEINLTICRPNDALLDNRGQRLVDCNSFYDSAIIKYGSPLSDKSNFFFLNNYNGKVSYLGVFRYLTASGPVNLYIQLDSRYTKDVIGYPALLLNYKQADNFNMPTYYSYAKYVDDRLVIFRGRYNYPTSLVKRDYHSGFSITKRDGYRHFVNKLSEEAVVVISRPQRDIYPYLVSFSYLILFYSAFLFLFLRIRRIRKHAVRIKLPKNSFRRKITYLLTTSLVSSLICMGLGSVWFSINYYKESNRLNMEEKLQSVQATLSDFCKYAEQYNDINTPDLFQAMDKTANNTQVDINLYDPHGRLIRSTRPELFEKCILPSRMNSDAYYQMITENKRQVINNEKIGELSYYALYAPIFNNEGKLIAIANIPYFSKNSDLRGDVSSVVATIINIYILLILAAALGGTLLSNSISRPLAEISRKMNLIDVSKHAEHINYKNRDELGVLVHAYNKMVDDLEESTAKLAQTEREHAWSEMARQIAHEIKNPLTPMRLSIQHLIRLKKQGVEGWDQKFEDVANSILEQIDILSNTASEFSSFAKFYFEENQIVNLHELITEQKILFDTREDIKILYDSDSNDCMVVVRKGQIIRVIVNLLSNAIQAMEEIGHGYVRISLINDGGYYKVSFEDSGNGVKEEDVNKLFKPNFTTKSSGTGLGLAISRNIIEQSGGQIGYSTSELLGGANFWFTLPIY
jgi:two-component system, NtrC family, nitrogen regulation sensor histidine kinase NtrY